jgi:uncharacterized protein (TIGR02118 family)
VTKSQGCTAISRRQVLRGVSALAATATLSRAFADAAGGVSIGMRAYTAIFPGGEGIQFDHAYYRDVHLPQMQQLYGAALMRVEMRRPVVAEGAAPSPYAAIVNFWIPDPAVFAAASAAHGQTLVQDRAHFTNGVQEVQSEEVFAEVGKPASAIGPGERCLTVLYPYAAADRFNAEYYRDHHMTSLIKLFGHDTISRIEMRRGLVAPDGSNPPRYSGTVNIYIADLAAFTALAPANHQRVVDDIPNFTSVSPISFQTEVIGAFDNVV